MAIPHGFIQDLLARVDVVEVVGRYVQLRKTGANFLGLCPFHGEKSPSFTVSPTKQFYHCFGCGKNGDAIRFLMEHNGMSFVEAVQDLAQQHGLQVPDDHASPEERARAAERKQKQATLTDVLEKACEDYRKQLRTAQVAIDYLKQRGLTGRIAARFGLGYAPHGWHHLASVFPDYTDRLLEEAGLVIRHDKDGEDKRYDRFRDRIMFPIRNVKGECIGFGGRVLGDDKPKYLNSPETPVFSKGRELYGLFEARDALREQGFALVTEGYMDVVALAQLGFANAVATLGTACTPDHVHKLFRYTDQVVFSFDGDNAGRRAAHKALVAALPYATDTRSIKFLFLPPEHDPDSYIRAHGTEDFAALIKQATPLSVFLQQVGSEDCDLDSAEGRARMASQTRPLWQALPEGALRSQLLAELAAKTQLQVDELRSLWQTQAAHASPAPRRQEESSRPPEFVGDYGAPMPPPEPEWLQGGWEPAKPARRQGTWTPNRGGGRRTGNWNRNPVPPAPRARVRPTSGADHALRLLLLHMPLWESLSAENHALLCSLPAPHGPLFVWLDSQYQEHGALAWGTLEQALLQAPFGDTGLNLVRQYQALGLPPELQEVRVDLRSALRGLQMEDLKRQETLAAQEGDLERMRQLQQQRAALAATLGPAEPD
ncbi:DNA primase [Brachymonas denitrificans]|uniref:DNA primase n=1 Tax=Brachymonas denitrificans DSM 15123 TaxID=1121117 RepID=A0A1H8HYQ0_9BURK|nr:DNA primase [Brachymonas denitrificans]SEN61222.1 DNA primase [Brachymonas denitrificans DSM 15123]